MIPAKIIDNIRFIFCTLLLLLGNSLVKPILDRDWEKVSFNLRKNNFSIKAFVTAIFMFNRKLTGLTRHPFSRQNRFYPNGLGCFEKKAGIIAENIRFLESIRPQVPEGLRVYDTDTDEMLPPIYGYGLTANRSFVKEIVYKP